MQVVVLLISFPDSLSECWQFVTVKSDMQGWQAMPIKRLKINNSPEQSSGKEFTSLMDLHFLATGVLVHSNFSKMMQCQLIQKSKETNEVMKTAYSFTIFPIK